MGQGYGIFSPRAGQGGGVGGAQTGAVGTSITFGGSGIPIMGGAGGGGTNTTDVDFAGGGVTGAGQVPNIAGGLASAGAGSHGLLMTTNPVWATTCGCGGGTAGAAGVGGAGGNGGFGSGGGGGGGGVTGGAGGAGGNGLVISSGI